MLKRNRNSLSGDDYNKLDHYLNIVLESLDENLTDEESYGQILEILPDVIPHDARYEKLLRLIDQGNSAIRRHILEKMKYHD